MQLKDRPSFDNNCLMKVYFRFDDQVALDGLNFETIDKSFYSEGYNYVIGSISLAQLFKQMKWLSEHKVFVATFP